MTPEEPVSAALRVAEAGLAAGEQPRGADADAPDSGARRSVQTPVDQPR